MNAIQNKSLEGILTVEGDTSELSARNIKRISSSLLFGDAKKVVIAHLDEFYMLTMTKQKKLLLTKVKQDVY